MKLFARMKAWFKRLFGKKLPDPVKFSTPGPTPDDVKNALQMAEMENRRIAYAHYSKTMRKKGLRPQRFHAWLGNRDNRRTRPTGGMDHGFWIHAKHNGTFSPVKPIKPRTDLSQGGDVHRARVAGRIQTRAARRKAA